MLLKWVLPSLLLFSFVDLAQASKSHEKVKKCDAKAKKCDAKKRKCGAKASKCHKSIYTTHTKNRYRFEINANPHQEGDAFEIGFSTPYLFKFRKNSPHYWSYFLTVGANVDYNSSPSTVQEAEDIMNLEIITGIAANASFYKDFIFQYGKIGVDAIFYDEKLKNSTGIGGFFEAGLEFKSPSRNISLHTGVRWRFALPEVDHLGPGVDPFEGVSMVFGTRYYF